MANERKFSRKRHAIKLTNRETLERTLIKLIQPALAEHDPTAYPTAIRLISELTAVIASQLLIQTQADQRALITLRDDIADYGSEFVAQLMIEARRDVAARVKKTTVVQAPAIPSMLADDWAGPVAGPTLIERHYGIPRSTLYRWQKRNEVVALNTRTSSKPVFPLRQFVDGRPAYGIAEILDLMPDPRRAWQWLIAPCPDLEGRSPIDVLLEGRTSDVIEAARKTVPGMSSP